MPLKQSSTAAMKGFTAGNYRWEVDSNPTGTANWLEIRGLTGGTPKFEQITEDDSDQSTGGWKQEFPTGNGWSASLKGFVKGTGVAPARVVDPGVQYMLNAGRTLGDAAVVHVRFWRTDEVAEAYEGYATCKSTLEDGKPPKLQEWSADLMGRGEPTVITKPESASPVAGSLTLNGATTFNLGFNGISSTDLTATSTATQIQTAVRAITGMTAVNVTGSTGGPYALDTIPAGTRLSILSDNGLATLR